MQTLTCEHETDTLGQAYQLQDAPEDFITPEPQMWEAIKRLADAGEPQITCVDGGKSYLLTVVVTDLVDPADIPA